MPEPVNLARLREFSDGPAGVAELVRLFLEDARDSMAQLAAARDAGDAPALRFVAHRFGGTCAACGAEDMAAALFALERIDAGSAPGPAALRLVDTIHDAYADVTAFFTAYLEGSLES